MLEYDVKVFEFVNELGHNPGKLSVLTKLKDYIFELSDNNENPELLWEYLSQIEGLDIEQVKKDINNPLFDQIMDIDSNDARQLEVRGTPSIFVNGKRLQVLSQQALLDLVENEIYK
jgi:protein-disulfide isomerase